MADKPTQSPEQIASAAEAEGVTAEIKDDAADALRKQQESEKEALSSKLKKEKEDALVTNIKTREGVSGTVEQGNTQVEVNETTETATGNKPESTDGKPESKEGAKEENEADEKKEDQKVKAEESKDTTSETPAKTVNKNASIFSKSRWSSIALGLAKELIRNAKSKKVDDSFFAGFGDKLRLIGIQVICWFAGKAWYNDPSIQDDKEILYKKYGISATGDDKIFEFVDPPEGDDTSINSYIKSDDILTAQFDTKDPFGKIDELKEAGLNEPDLTFAALKAGVAKVKTKELKDKCDALIAAMKPVPKDNMKIIDFFGKYGDSVAEELNLVDKMKNIDLINIVDTPFTFDEKNTSFTYRKMTKIGVASAGNERMSGPTIDISKDSVKIDDKIFKIVSKTAGTEVEVKSIQGVRGEKPDDQIKLRVIVNVGGSDHTIDDFMNTLPDGDVPLEIGENFKLEVPKEVTEDETASEESAAPAAAVVAATATAAPEVVPEKTPETLKKENEDSAVAGITAANSSDDVFKTPFEFKYSVPGTDGKQSEIICTFNGITLKIGEKTYKVGVDINGPDQLLKSVKIESGNIIITDTGYVFGMGASVHTSSITKFAEVIEKMRTSDETADLDLGNGLKMNFTKV